MTYSTIMRLELAYASNLFIFFRLITRWRAGSCLWDYFLSWSFALLYFKMDLQKLGYGCLPDGHLARFDWGTSWKIQIWCVEAVLMGSLAPFFQLRFWILFCNCPEPLPSTVSIWCNSTCSRDEEHPVHHHHHQRSAPHPPQPNRWRLVPWQLW